jgi:HAD superfamily hydrolase (TIGR01490 family)
MTVAALFDMDNTLLRIDSGTSYSRFLYSRGELDLKMVGKVLYWNALYKLAVLDMEAVYRRLCADLEGDVEAELIGKCDAWYLANAERAVAPAARVAIERHRRAGHVIALATGSTIYAAGPVARGVGIEHVLATELEVERGVFTGRPRAMCFGRYKVELAEAWAGKHAIDLTASYFYSDSYNDLPMLSRVGHAIAINPDARLRRHARRQGWPIARWA